MQPIPAPAIGLCATCAHGKRLESSRGSFFHMCQLADKDAAFARYPRLPMRVCAGYVEAAPPPGRT